MSQRPCASVAKRVKLSRLLWEGVMKKLLLGSAALGVPLAVGSTMAADLAIKAPVYKAPVMAPVYNWKGFYVGANLGWSFGRASTDWTIAGVPVSSTSQNMDGILGGLQAGYNWQSSNWYWVSQPTSMPR